MNFEQYKVIFEKEASNSGYSETNIRRCLTYAEILFANKVPVIYNTSHLSVLVGYNKRYLKRAVVYTPYFYRDFQIKKKNGKFRKISEPLPSLKEIQTWILENILSNIPISPFAKAYKKNTSIIENLRFHVNQPKVFTLDLENFFPSIKTDSIESIFLNVGYSKILSNLMAKLCTRDNSLPQGAPTSPYLSNIFFKPVDDIISRYCIDNKIRYTRYADDLSFSGDFDENSLMEFVSNVISELNLTINKNKTRLMTPNMRQTVTGIVVNKKTQVVFHKRNNLRKDIYYIKKYGLHNHMKFRNIKQSNYLEHLLGKVNFVLQLNPNDIEFKRYKNFLIELKNKIE
ncbi:reverse transcriptase family protein [Candidatus Sulfidibacterium hydrothermale]|uniref:reverse transcriptase domain-containing protein n=1 Tax=Candidatus Sulfidibacterium hydrothermale TaxID=2875962 RepID=UPI001F0A3FD9|nr:reverse transcriptase domain-containing protein [Candidatus Sulfidibacterium hydrothermale]UBM61323.1 reverse transcriptase family protein [Candidatus Sulfidibacterium hydrothermale]